jgi:glyoxylase-like metal-dependent hydrolase (beta-lactamase superfamily II)
VLLADNPGPMTLDGTNSYLLSSVAGRELVVVDPGPADDAHLRTLADQGAVELILLTHRHLDHSAGAARLAELTGAPVRAADPLYCLGGAPLENGEVITAAGLQLEVLATPGHTTDSVCFQIVTGGDAGPVFTGDTILGRGTTVIVHPDGHLGSYLASLDTLAALGPALVLPGHGPELSDLAAVCAAYAEHRQQRLDSVRAALLVLGADASVSEVADLVYADVEPDVRGAAELSVAAQLHYLRDRG